jgi:hypothetical protein
MKKRIVLLVCLFSLVLAINTLAGKRVEKNVTIEKDDIDLLVININLAAGVFEIQTDDIDDIMKADISYRQDQIDVFTDYEKDDRTGFLELGCDAEWIDDIDTKDNSWDITLSRKYPAEVTLDMGACKTNIDLGGIPIKMLEIDIGAAKGTLDFSQPNPRIADQINIESGAAKFKVKNLGNANFKRLSFDGGIGKFELDFSGKYTHMCRAEISIGLGSMDIYIPRDLPVKIDAESNFLAAVDFDNPDRRGKMEDDYYESDNFRDSDYGLSLEIDIGLGSVNLVWVD